MTRLYGPHRPEDAPAHVLIHRGGRKQRAPIERDVPVPIPRRLLQQRQQINTRAWEAHHRAD